MKLLILPLLCCLFLWSCDNRGISQNDIQELETIKLVSLPFFGQWGYERQYEISVSTDKVKILCVSSCFTQTIIVNNNQELADVVSDMLNDLQYGFPDKNTEIGVRPQDAGGLTVIGHGKTVSIYKSENDQLGFYEKRLIDNVGKLITALDEYNFKSGF